MKRLFILTLVLSLIAAPVSGAEQALDSVSSQEMSEVVEHVSLVEQLRKKIAQLNYRLYSLQTNTESAKGSLEDIREAIDNLEGLIEELEVKVAQKEKGIRNVKTQTERKKMEIEDLEEEVQILELQLVDQKKTVSELMTLLYMKEGVYYDQGEVNAVKVLASTDSVSETLQEMTYLDILKTEQEAQMQRMLELDTELKANWQALRTKRDELDRLDETLAEELRIAEDELQSQKGLLTETRVEEAILESMLIASDGREEDIVDTIEIYQKSLENLLGKRSLLSEEQKALIEVIELEQLSDEEVSVEEITDFVDLQWPVSPSRGITAYFHDEGYVNAFGVDHYATDIRANQGSIVTAPADGVVYDVRMPNGPEYAYVMIAHRKGIMTLMGHMSEIRVQIGEFVAQGQPIGLSGGMPGEKGSGYRTTGPHMHFEVWDNGARIDPLSIMPLDQIPADDLPEGYESRVQSQLEDRIRSIQEGLSS